MSLKLLEISILSAQDLAPVSKLLRTYAVAWVHPDQKLTTPIDHRGHTNPTWNYRFVFRVDDQFLSTAAASTLTVQIYNVSWLRDIPIGTSEALIATILPPLSSTARFLSLQIRRPTGSLHGTLNVSVNLIDNAVRRSLPPDGEIKNISASACGSDKRSLEEENQRNAKIQKLRRSLSDHTESMSINDELSVSSSKFRKSQATTWSISSSEFSGRFRKSKTMKESILSYYIRPLPSEVAADMAKGLYSKTSEEEIGSSILENWTVVGGGGEDKGSKTKAARWQKDKYSLPTEHNVSKKRSKGCGLLSCFWNACGYQCNIICGAPKRGKKINKKRFGETKRYVNPPADNLPLLYR